MPVPRRQFPAHNLLDQTRWQRQLPDEYTLPENSRQSAREQSPLISIDNPAGSAINPPCEPTLAEASLRSCSARNCDRRSSVRSWEPIQKIVFSISVLLRYK